MVNRTDYISHTVLIFGCEKSTSCNIRSMPGTAGFYRLKDSMPWKSTGKPEELRIPIRRLTLEDVQKQFSNNLHVARACS